VQDGKRNRGAVNCQAADNSCADPFRATCYQSSFACERSCLRRQHLSRNLIVYKCWIVLSRMTFTVPGRHTAVIEQGGTDIGKPTLGVEVGRLSGSVH